MESILIFTPWARYTPHLETDLEIIQGHLDAGDTVALIGCDAELSACDRNPSHDMARCVMCIGKRKTGTRLLTAQPASVPLYNLTTANKTEAQQLRTQFRDVGDLKSYRVDNYDIGYAVLSSAISFFRDPNPMSAANESVIRRLILSAFAVYRSFQNHLATGNYSKVYIFNGRFAITRAVVRACESVGMTYVTHERGHDHKHYRLFPNTTPHDLQYRSEQMILGWDKVSNRKDAEKIGSRFFTERAKGREQGWYSFTSDQQDNLLPEDWDESQKNVSLFISSEDELAALGEDRKNPIYQDQADGIRQIIHSTARCSRLRLYLRVHPNLKGIVNAQTRVIGQLQAPHLRIIPAESKVSSYALIQKSDLVITFGSTVGIEAVFWGTPSIMAGRSLYESLGGTYNPKDHAELVGWITSDLQAKDIAAALMYGYHMKTSGTAYKHYRPEGVFRGTFDGVRVRPGLAGLTAASVLKVVPPLAWLAKAWSLRRVEQRFR